MRGATLCGVVLIRTMYIFSIRKCLRATRLALLVVFVVNILVLFEQWRGGKKNAGAAYSDPLEAAYESEILEDEARIIPGLGEGGAPAFLIGREKKLGEESKNKLAMNVYLSDRIAYNRTLNGELVSNVYHAWRKGRPVNTGPLCGVFSTSYHDLVDWNCDDGIFFPVCEISQ